jgi:sarcosine oxidase subunit alpha
MAGGRMTYSPRAARYLPDSGGLPDSVLVSGGLAGDGTLEELARHATATGAEAARRSMRARGAGPAAPVPGLPAGRHPELFACRTSGGHGARGGHRGHGFVDLSEDVTDKDLSAAVAEGYDSAELAKRYTTATMGPLQGKLESVNAVAIVAAATGQSMAEAGTTTWRPPYVPVTLAALAGPPFDPVRVSPMQPWHEAHGAVPLQAGAWIRPDHYGDPAGEAVNVRRAVGIIDVTPIGKLDLRGPDVPRLLNLLYVNKWSRLEAGRVRYGVMCADDGVVFDDGVTGRLGPEHYLMSTTSSGAAAVWEWAENWLQTAHPDWRVHITPVTTAFASMNVAGPRSRELLSRVTEGVSLSAEDFPYMHVRAGRVAGVDGCVLWRIGFTGELSYELHVPAGYGLHVWETLLARGADLGIRPFGVEAQRILRLEKGHLIVGQDTDGLTRGFSAGLEWAIRLDKDDFAGQPELAWQRDEWQRAGGGPRLVALQPSDETVVPPEASQILRAGRIAGRVTSSRMSPALGRSICLAQVDADLAEPGTLVTIRLPSGTDIVAMVMPHLAHLDPEGGRLRG